MDKENLLRKVSRNSQIVGDLKNSQAWQMIVEDFTAEKQRIDDCWQSVADEKHFQELRVAKLAITQILNLLPYYEQDLKVAGEQLQKVDDPEAMANANYGEK